MSVYNHKQHHMTRSDQSEKSGCQQLTLILISHWSEWPEACLAVVLVSLGDNQTTKIPLLLERVEEKL